MNGIIKGQKRTFLSFLAVFGDPVQQNSLKIILMCLSCDDLTTDISHAYIYSSIFTVVEFWPKKCFFWLLLGILGFQKSENSAKIMLNEDIGQNSAHFYTESMVFMQLV